MQGNTQLTERIEVAKRMDHRARLANKPSTHEKDLIETEMALWRAGHEACATGPGGPTVAAAREGGPDPRSSGAAGAAAGAAGPAVLVAISPRSDAAGSAAAA